MTLRAGSYALRLVKQIARAKDSEAGLGKQNAVWHVSSCQRRGQNFSGEVGGLVGIAFAAAGAASPAKRNAVFGEHVGQTLDLADVRNCEEHLVACAGELLGFLEHGGNRAMEAGRGLRQEGDASLRIVIALDAEVFDIGTGKCGDFPPEIVWAQIQIFGADEISYAA